MNKFKMLIIAAVLLCFYVRNSELSPLPQSWSGASSADHTENPTAFLIANGVTQEEIEEFQRQNGLFPPTAENEDTDESQSRSFGNFLPSLPSSKGIAAAAIGIGAAAKFLIATSAFDHFRNWIQDRRRLTTTIKPIPVYIVKHPEDSHPYTDDIYVSPRPSYFM